MILIGAQFLNYACFKQQFVPLRSGLNLLVGKNNAGKTALLRGVAAMSALPLANWRSMMPETVAFINSLREYVREFDPEPQYEFEILFRIEEGDNVPLETSRLPWPKLIQERGALSAYKFWVMPQRAGDQIIFNSCELRISGLPSVVILRSNPGLEITKYDLPAESGTPTPIETRQLATSGKYVSGPDQISRIVPLPSVDRYFEGLAPLAHVRYVSPHRVVAPWIQLQTAESIPDNAENLAVFLQTLHGRNRKAFQAIESFVLSVFPEFSAVNPASSNNSVRITFTRRDVDKDIPLTHCGTGVEQVLAIATFAVTAERGAILLIDEPHSFLHPTAERQIIDFLRKDQNHRFVVSTHSAIFMNSVTPDRIVNIEAPGKPYRGDDHLPNIGQILFDLGYRNSDILFYDNLVIVEGKTDKAILPILLSLAGVSSDRLARVGFPILEGAPERLRDLQTAILKYERLINALCQSEIERVYLLDGDRAPDDVTVLKSMRAKSHDVSIPVKFIPMTEIENYLLVPIAIAAAIGQEAELAGAGISVTPEDVQRRMCELLETDDPKLFPRGKKSEPARDVKGSALLERLYDSFANLVYDKDHSGVLIAHHIHAKEQPAIYELRDLLKDIFPA